MNHIPTTGSMKDAKERIRLLEDQSRRKNLTKSGIAELQNETSEQTRKKVDDLIKDKLNIPNMQVVSAYRVGSKDPNKEEGR